LAIGYTGREQEERLRFWFILSGLALAGAASRCHGLTCDLRGYRPEAGLRAEVRGDVLELDWLGERGEPLRARFTIQSGEPRVQELAARGSSGWVVLGQDLTPEFEVTSGKRRLSEQQMAPLRELGIALTPEVIDREKWYAFWDAPLMIPGRPGTNLDLPRKPDEIRRAWATYNVTGCSVKTDGARIEASFPGIEMGIFSGLLQFTVYRGSNFLRQEVIAKTEEPSVAYKYAAGLKGFPIREKTRLVWRDVARAWQHYEFGGAVNEGAVGVRARNRLEILETGGGSLGVLPPPHKFFFAREIETNLGYVYYRKDGANAFALGVRQPDREIGYKPYGVSDAVWQRRVNEARGEINNFALYNAPPGTLQRMPSIFISARTMAAPHKRRSLPIRTMTPTNRYQGSKCW
jgi:hypothetical protein